MSDMQHKRADELAETFEMFDEWEDRYAFLIDLGRKIPPLGDSERTEENRVHGCQSRVWLVARARPGGVIDFVADSDSSIVKGLIAVLQQVYSGYPAEEILGFDVEALFTRLGLDQHLTLGRRNGLHEMVRRIRRLAAAHAREPVAAG